MFTQLRNFLTARSDLSGWRRRALAFACGVSATLTLPPFFIFPLIVPAFAGLFLLVYRAPSRRQAFWDGWWWGWGFYITGIYWFCIALLTDAEKFGWLIPFTLFGLTAVIAIYHGISCWLYKRVNVSGIAGIFVFSVIWTVMEYARGHLFSGFPWNLPGYSMEFSVATLQSASLVGIYGLSWYVVFFGAIPAALALSNISAHRARRAVYLTLLTLVIASAWGTIRLHNADALPESQRYVDNVRLRLVQGNIPQQYKWDEKHQLEGLKEYVRLTNSPGIENITHVIWPETAVPYNIKPHSGLTRYLGDNIPSGAHLITGALRIEGDAEHWDIWNSLTMLDHNGEIVGQYDKAKLVPFGEFLPFRSLLPASWLTPVGEKDFSSGEGMQTLHWPGLPGVSPLICYEVIFPERAVDRNNPPDWLLSVTNDAWFGQSTGPYQHFHMARMRAVEQGLPLIRVANTGITASIDAYGRILNSIELGKKEILDIQLNKSQHHATIYSNGGYLFMLLLVVTALVLIVRAQKPEKN